MKLSPVRGVVKGKRVIMVDDSIVRGTTSRRIVRMLRDAGATEVHVVISSPPIKNPCFYGIDTSRRDELIAADNSVEDIRREIEADTLTFISTEGMLMQLGIMTAVKHVVIALPALLEIIQLKSMRISICQKKKLKKQKNLLKNKDELNLDRITRL